MEILVRIDAVCWQCRSVWIRGQGVPLRINWFEQSIEVGVSVRTGCQPTTSRLISTSPKRTVEADAAGEVSAGAIGPIVNEAAKPAEDFRKLRLLLMISHLGKSLDTCRWANAHRLLKMLEFRASHEPNT